MYSFTVGALAEGSLVRSGAAINVVESRQRAAARTESITTITPPIIVPFTHLFVALSAVHILFRLILCFFIFLIQICPFIFFTAFGAISPLHLLFFCAPFCKLLQYFQVSLELGAIIEVLFHYLLG